ncbi:Gfo/Idh/MocA family protein [Ruania halotolerans]|uniref:Gfo/Idh/MocA family protein n=1 Tax=Ruania halotolerans TaxID=2897773 RepID=UPI001E59CF25|nr:Gfo/Idh/MocA family oxidoreductase [Ruania halotolerans]UFU06904.1 Gfo/Idh/MocA family oxidoreductase [Ruania halotolerans]
MTPVRFGVIGVGIIGRQHVARLLADNGTAELVAIADSSEDAARAVAAEYGTEAMPLGSLLARADVDAIVIAIPSGLHADVAVAALEAGKHVLLEKPIDVTVEAADRIIAAERRSGRVLSVVSQRRFLPESQFLHRSIRSGVFGSITSATVEIALWRTQEYYDSGAWRGTWALDGGGALMNQGVHMVDMILWLLGEVEEVHAYGGLLAHENIEVEDTISITARFASGAVLTFLASTTAFGDLPIRVAIMGDGGTAVTAAGKFEHFVSAQGSEPPEFASRDMEREQLVDFVEAIQCDREPLVTSSQARAAVAFIEAAYESMRTGRAVRPR